MPYRLNGTQPRSFATNLYGYSFPLNGSKVVDSIVLLNNRNVVILGIAFQAN